MSLRTDRGGRGHENREELAWARIVGGFQDFGPCELGPALASPSTILSFTKTTGFLAIQCLGNAVNRANPWLSAVYSRLRPRPLKITRFDRSTLTYDSATAAGARPEEDGFYLPSDEARLAKSILFFYHHDREGEGKQSRAVQSSCQDQSRSGSEDPPQWRPTRC